MPRHRRGPAPQPSPVARAAVRRIVVPLMVCALAGTGGALARTALSGPAPQFTPAVTDGRGATGPAAVSRRGKEIEQLLDEHYYRRVDAAALSGGPVEQLPVRLGDPYTHYLKPETLAAWNRTDTGRYVGIGVVVDTTARTGLQVTVILPGSPAAAAGVQAGDQITAVDGHDTSTLATPQALELVRGPAGSTVHLTVDRADGSRRALRLTRAEVRAQLVTSRLTPVATGTGAPPVQVGVIRIMEFDQHVGSQVRAAAADLVRHGAARLVLDLRGNPGGLIDQTLPVVSAFTPAGTAVYSQDGLHVDHLTYRTGQQPVTTSLPLTVLIDHDTASAAEIVAGALQDAHRATLEGTTTYGKGVMQQIWPLPSGGGLKLTVAEFTTPAGHHIQHTGIQPDQP